MASLVFALGVYFWWELKRGEERQIGETVRAAGRILDRQLMEELDRRIAALKRLSGSFTIRADRPAQEWEQEASALARDYPGLIAIGWIDPKGAVAWAAPPAVSASVEKLHELISEERPEFIAEVATRKEPHISRVVEVANQGRVFPVYVPVVVNGRNNGMLMGSLHLQILFEAIFEKILDRSYGVALLDGYEVLFSRGKVPPETLEWESNTTVSIYGWNWRLRMWPESEQWAALRSPLPEIALLSATLVSAAILGLLLIPAPLRETAAPPPPVAATEVPSRTRKERSRHLVWEAALASVGDSIIVLEPEVVPEGGLLVQYVNKAFVELTGWPPEQIKSRTLRPLFDAADLREQTQKLRAATQEPQATQLDLRVKRADGSSFAASLFLRPVPDESGHVGHWIGVLREKEAPAATRLAPDAKAEMAARRQALSALFDSSSLAVVGCDVEARVRIWNRAAEELFGWPAGETLGKKQPALPAGAFLSGVAEPKPVMARHHDGTPCAVTLWSAMMPAPADPELRWLFFCAAADTAHDAKQEAHLSGLRRLLEWTADLLLVVTGDGRIEFASPQTAELLGAPPQGLLGRPLGEFVQSGDREALAAGLARFEPDAAAGPEPMRVRLLGADGGHTLVEFSGLREPGSELLLVCGRDLSAQERIGEKLAQAEAAQRRAEEERGRLQAQREALEEESERRRQSFAAEEQRLREAQREAVLAAAAAQQRLAAVEQEQAAARERLHAAQRAAEDQAGASLAAIENARVKAREELERAAAEWRELEARQQESARQAQTEQERIAELRREAEQLRTLQAEEAEALRAERVRLTEIADRAAKEEQRLATAREEALELQRRMAEDATRIEATRREALALRESLSVELEESRTEQERLAEEAARVAAARERALALQREQEAKAEELRAEQRRIAQDEASKLEELRVQQERLAEETRAAEAARRDVEALRASHSAELDTLRDEQERLAEEATRVNAAREQALALLAEQSAQANALRGQQERLAEETRAAEAARRDVEALRASHSAELDTLRAEQERLAEEATRVNVAREQALALLAEQSAQADALRVQQERLREDEWQLEETRAQSALLHAEQVAESEALRLERERVAEARSRLEAMRAAAIPPPSDIEAARGILTAFALRESEERYRLAAQSTRDGIWDWDLRADRIYYSPRWKQMLDFDDNDLTDAPEEWLLLIHPTDLAGFQALLDAHLRGQTTDFEAEYRVRNKQGAYVWMGARGQAVRDPDGKPLRLVGSQTDLSEQKAMEEQLIREAFHDPLTQLPNRALFLDRLGVLLDRLRQARAQRKEAAHFAVLFLDLDRFKDINDTLGHLAGDKLLVEMGRRLAASLGPEDTVARHGGDEFTVLLSRAATEEDVNRAATRLLAAARLPMLFEGIEIQQSLSIGSTRSALGYDRPEDMLRDADTALYEAKSRGRDTHVPFTITMLEAARNRFRLETDLRHAVERGEFVLLYQPIFQLHERGTKLDGLEALLRWNHPHLGTLAPADFLASAEDIGLLGEIDHWVLREACWQMKKCSTSGGVPAGSYVSVNLSAAVLRRPDIVASIQALLRETGLGPERLHLEVSERSLRAAPDAGAALTELHQMGIALHLDDFGSGQSSIELLSLLPWDRVKLDRSLLSESRNRILLETVLLLSRRLGLRIAAEGVESEHEAALLRESGCKFAQGFRFAAPLARGEAERLLAAHA